MLRNFCHEPVRHRNGAAKKTDRSQFGGRNSRTARPAAGKWARHFFVVIGAVAIAALGLGFWSLARRLVPDITAPDSAETTKDALDGAEIMKYLAVIYAWCGEKDRVLARIGATLRIPSTLSYGNLKLHPNWDSLRGDPRFEKIVADSAPKNSAP